MPYQPMTGTKPKSWDWVQSKSFCLELRRVRMIKKMLLVVIVGATLVGCQGRVEVCVVDSAGKPVAGAKVTAQTASMNAVGVLTDNAGRAGVTDRISVQKVQWVVVTKPGYDIAWANIEKGPLVVTLTKVGEVKTTP
jgi:hypothetical protein